MLAAATARADSTSNISHLSAINDEVGLTPAETYAFAKQYGIQWLEMRGAQVPKKRTYCETLSDAALRELKKQLDDNGVRVSVLDTSLLKFTLPGTVSVKHEDFYIKYFADLGLTDEKLYRDRIDMLKRAIAAAHALDTGNLRIFAFWRVQDPAPLFPRIAEILSEMAEVAQKEKVRLLIENETATNICTSAETVDILGRIRSPALGLNWDPQNAIALEPDQFPAAYAKLPKDRIGNVHVKAEGLLGPKHPLDWGAIMRQMLRDGYTGKFSLETHRGKDAANVKVSHTCMEKMTHLVNSG